MTIDKGDYQRLAGRFRGVFEPHASQLSDEAVQSVRHYLEVAELEMAYESFVLSAVQGNARLADEARNELLALGVILGLDQQSIFRADFWDVAGSFLTARE